MQIQKLNEKIRSKFKSKKLLEYHYHYPVNWTNFFKYQNTIGLFYYFHIVTFLFAISFLRGQKGTLSIDFFYVFLRGRKGTLSIFSICKKSDESSSSSGSSNGNCSKLACIVVVFSTLIVTIFCYLLCPLTFLSFFSLISEFVLLLFIYSNK